MVDEILYVFRFAVGYDELDDSADESSVTTVEYTDSVKQLVHSVFIPI